MSRFAALECVSPTENARALAIFDSLLTAPGLVFDSHLAEPEALLRSQNLENPEFGECP